MKTFFMSVIEWKTLKSEINFWFASEGKKFDWCFDDEGNFEGWALNFMWLTKISTKLLPAF